MGWYYEHGSRADLIADRIKPQHGDRGTRRAIRHCCVGNVLWTVWEREIKVSAGLDGPCSTRWIGCDLMECRGGDWGYKPMCEEMGPYYYSCPLSYLAMVPTNQNKDWREDVRLHHARRQQRKRKEKMTY